MCTSLCPLKPGHTIPYLIPFSKNLDVNNYLLLFKIQSLHWMSSLCNYSIIYSENTTTSVKPPNKQTYHTVKCKWKIGIQKGHPINEMFLFLIMLYLANLPKSCYVTPKGTINKQIRWWTVGGGNDLHHYVSLNRVKLSWPSMHLHSNNHKISKTAGCKKYTKLIKWSCGLDMVTSLSPAINVSTTLQWGRERSQ